MLTATLLALAAAVLHAGWNLIAKRAIDPFLALWSQFLLAGVVSLPVIVVGSVAGHGPSGRGWLLAGLTAAIHLPYVVLLARAYRIGDFSSAYPLARGGGALFAALGGIALLGDRITVWAGVAIVVVVGGLSMLSAGAGRRAVQAAIGVAVTIGAYTVVDSHAARGAGGPFYVFAAFSLTAVVVTMAAVVTGRRPTGLRRPDWLRASIGAVLSIAAYGLVLVAVRRAPVGYVAVLRESSVLLAALIGWRVLGEGRSGARAAGAVAIVVGLIVLTATSTIR